MGRELDPLALRQLRAWEEIAETWELVQQDNEPHVRCGECGTSVLKLADDKGNVYQYDPSDVLALTVAHLRNKHLELDPCKEIV